MASVPRHEASLTHNAHDLGLFILCSLPGSKPDTLLRSMAIMSPTSVLHSLADQAAHGVNDAGAGCAVHTATQGQEKSSLEGAKDCVNQAADRLCPTQSSA